jgi:hypothetical protein
MLGWTDWSASGEGTGDVDGDGFAGLDALLKVSVYFRLMSTWFVVTVVLIGMGSAVGVGIFSSLSFGGVDPGTLAIIRLFREVLDGEGSICRALTVGTGVMSLDCS